MSNNVVTKRIAWADMYPLPNNPILETRLKRIESEGGFKPEFVGVPELALNDNQAFVDLPADAVVLIDGHHRRELAKRANGSAPKEVICKIHRGLTRTEIEQRFLALNDARMHHVNELFVHRVASGDRAAVEMNKIIEAAGFVVHPYSGGQVCNAISGANAVEWVYTGGKRRGAKVYPRALTRTLEGIRAMWPSDINHGKSNLIKGIGAFHLRYGDLVDVDVLHRNVKTKYPTVSSLLNQAAIYKDALQVQVPHAMGYTITKAYNFRKHGKNSLPEWR